MPTDDIRDQLTDNCHALMARVDTLRAETDPLECHVHLEELRREWIAHVLAEETVVYHAIEGARHDGTQPSDASVRLVEHELLQRFLDRLSHTTPGSAVWIARLDVVAKLIRRHMDEERGDLFSRLAHDYGTDELTSMGRHFGLARKKITLLERAKDS